MMFYGLQTTRSAKCSADFAILPPTLPYNPGVLQINPIKHTLFSLIDLALIRLSSLISMTHLPHPHPHPPREFLPDLCSLLSCPFCLSPSTISPPTLLSTPRQSSLPCSHLPGPNGPPLCFHRYPLYVSRLLFLPLACELPQGRDQAFSIQSANI